MNTPCTVDPDVMYDNDRVQEAKAVCGACPLAVRARCAELAEQALDPYGVYAGESGPERLGRLILAAGGGDDVPAVLWTRFRDACEYGTWSADKAAERSSLPVELIVSRYGWERSKRKPRAEVNASISAVRAAAGAEMRDRCRELATAGHTITEICAIVDRQWKTVRNHCGDILAANQQAKREPAHRMFAESIAVPVIAERTGIGERTLYRWRQEWEAEKGVKSRRTSPVVAAGSSRALQAVSERTGLFRGRAALNLETVRALTLAGKSRAEIAAETGYSEGSVSRARKVLNAAARRGDQLAA